MRTVRVGIDVGRTADGALRRLCLRSALAGVLVQRAALAHATRDRGALEQRSDADSREGSEVNSHHSRGSWGEGQRPWGPPRMGAPVWRHDMFEMAVHGVRAGLVAGVSGSGN